MYYKRVALRKFAAHADQHGAAATRSHGQSDSYNISALAGLVRSIYGIKLSLHERAAQIIKCSSNIRQNETLPHSVIWPAICASIEHTNTRQPTADLIARNYGCTLIFQIASLSAWSGLCGLVRIHTCNIMPWINVQFMTHVLPLWLFDMVSSALSVHR